MCLLASPFTAIQNVHTETPPLLPALLHLPTAGKGKTSAETPLHSASFLRGDAGFW